MNPNDIPRWLDEHGGADGPPQTDVNGVTTHRAVDGSYVTVFNGQVRMIGHGSPSQGEQQQAAPAAQTQRQGVGMTQQELEAIINGWGASLGAGDFREEVKQEDVPNPAAYDENGQYIQGTPLTVKGPVTYRTWVKPGTNQRLTVKVNTDGTYTKVYDGADSSIQPSRAPDAQAPKEEKNPNDPTRMRRWNPQSKQWEDAGPNQEEIERREKERAAANKPQTVSTNTTEPYIVTRMPDGSLKQEPNPNYKGPEPKPSTNIQIKGSDGKTYLVPIGPDGKPGKPVDSGVPADNPNTPEPEGAPKPSFTVGDAAADLQKYQQWLNSEMRKPGATLTAARADQLLEARRKLWDTALSEQAGIVNAQQSAFRDQLQQRGQTLNDQQSRRSSATSIANQTEGDYAGLMDKMGANPGGASIAQAIAEARFNAGAFVDSMSGGGVPEIKMGPAYAQTAGMQLNPRAGSPVPTIPQTVAPAASVPAQPAMAAPPTAPPPAPAAPAFRPMPVAPAPVQAAPPQPSPLSPGQSGMMSPVLDSENPPVPQNPGQPGMMSPYQDAENPAIPRAGAEAGGNVQMAPVQPAPWFLAGSSNGRAYDPSPAIASLVADPNIDNEMLRQAVQMEYPGYDIDALLGRRSA